MNIIKKIITLLYLFLFFSMALNAEPIVWNKEQMLKSIDSRKANELKSFISVATKEQLNEVVTLPYDQGNASLLGLVMQTMFQQNGFHDIISLMIERGSNVEGIENDIVKPLAVAVKQNKWVLAKKLLDAGASIDIKVEQPYHSEKLPLFYMALENKDWEEFLKYSLDYNPKLVYTKSMKENGKSYLKKALHDENPSVKLVKYLLAHGEKADEERRNTQSPYYEFLYRNNIYSTYKEDEAYRNRLEVFNLLLDTGINPLLQGNTNCLTPLTLVQDDIPTLNRLMDKGLKPNEGNCYNKSNLSISIILGNLEVFKVLLEKGGELFQGKNHIVSEPFLELISDKKSDKILKWLFTNKKDVFEGLSSEDVEKYYLEGLIKAQRDGAYLDVIETLLKSSKNYQATIDKMMRVAINSSKMKTAEYFSSLGAKLIDHSCECQQPFWNKELDGGMIDWLLAHDVNPFNGKKPIEEVVNINNLTLKHFKELVEIYPKDKPKAEMLQSLFATLLESYNLDKHFLLTEDKIEFLKSKGLKFDDHVDEYMAKQIKENNPIKIIWLLTQGARVSDKNQEHYIKTAYMRALIDRAGMGVDEVDFYPEDEEQKLELDDKIFDYFKENEWYLKNIALFVKPIEKVDTITDENSSSKTVSLEGETFETNSTFDNMIIAYKTKKVDKHRYTLFGIIGLFYISLFATLVTLIIYFRSERKEPLGRKVVPAKLLKIPFILTIIWWALFIFNAFSLDYEYLQYMKNGTDDYIALEWSSWFMVYLILQFFLLFSLFLIFRESFLRKNYYSVTFYGSLTFFIFSLLFPFLLMLLSDLHDGYQFAYIGGLL